MLCIQELDNFGYTPLSDSLGPLFGGLIRLPNYVWSVGGITLLGSGSFWGVASGTRHWATWSNDYRCIFKPTKPLKPKSKNHDNGRINIQYAFDMIALISSCNNS